MKIVSAVAAMVFLLAGCELMAPTRPSSPPPQAEVKPAPAIAAAPPVVVSSATTPSSAPPPAPLPPPVPFAQAVQAAANNLFSNAPLNPANRQPVVIDPLIDGVSGMESLATRAMEDRLVELMKSRYTALDLQPFSAATVRRAPWVLIGTFTPINAAGQAAGAKDAY